MGTYILCPGCGLMAYRSRVLTGVVLFHSPYAGDRCLDSQVYEDEAEAVRRIRAQGGERFRLAAHP